MSARKIVKAKAKETAGVKVGMPSTQARAAAPVQITHELIAQRAREIWNRKGMPEGQCEQNWMEAEAELRAAIKVAV